MYRRICLCLLLCAVMLLSGCGLKTLDEMYVPPKRSESDSQLQSAIDAAMFGLEYAAPIAGENQQTIQMADLDGDGREEYILFARSSNDKPLHILVFQKQEERVVLSAVIDNLGSAFEQVEYVEIDDRPGLEMVVGRRVSDQVLRSVSVYTFGHGEPEQLMSANYAKFLTCDLNLDGHCDLILLQPGQTDAENGVAVLHGFEKGEMTRSREISLSSPVDMVKRIMVSKLQSGQPAVFVASSQDENAIITDIFAMKGHLFTNISLSNESGTSVKTLRNYYVYADDVDADGVLELPSLITMRAVDVERQASRQYLIRWYAMDLNGMETDKMYTFHNFVGGWYLQLQGDWAERISVRQDGSSYQFYLWDPGYQHAAHVLSIFALTGSSREEDAVQDGRFVLYRADGITYSAKLEAAADCYEINQENVISAFQPILPDWKTGET